MSERFRGLKFFSVYRTHVRGSWQKFAVRRAWMCCCVIGGGKPRVSEIQYLTACYVSEIGTGN